MNVEQGTPIKELRSKKSKILNPNSIFKKDLFLIFD